jgi:hypothetical protein
MTKLASKCLLIIHTFGLFNQFILFACGRKIESTVKQFLSQNLALTIERLLFAKHCITTGTDCLCNVTRRDKKTVCLKQDDLLVNIPSC